MTPFSFLRSLGTGIVLLAFSGEVYAQQSFAFNKPVELVVGFAGGTTTDLIARILADGLQKQIGQPVLVVNKVGASGMIASQSIQYGRPDGHAITLTSTVIATVQTMKKQPDFDVRRDVIAVTKVLESVVGLFASHDAPFDDVAGMVAYARANPGKVAYGTTGIGTTVHLSTESLAAKAGISLKFVPYAGSTAALQGLMRNEIEILINDAAVGLPLVEDKKLKLIAIANSRRAKGLPAIPTIAESGVKELADFNLPLWFGMFLSPKTPPDVVELWNKDINETLRDPEVLKKLALLGYEEQFIGGTAAPRDFQNFVAQEVDRYSRIVEEAKIEKQ